MKYKKSFLYLGICSILLFGIVQIVFGSTLSAFQGGTGIATSTPSNDGFCLQQVSSTPFLTWTEGACASGSPGTSTITAQGVTITGPGFTFATSGPMLSITVSGQTVTFTNSSSSLNLQNLVPNTRAINTNAPLTGGGVLSADLTLGCATCITTSSVWIGGVNSSTFNLGQNLFISSSGTIGETSTPVFTRVSSTGITFANATGSGNLNFSTGNITGLNGIVGASSSNSGQLFNVGIGGGLQFVNGVLSSTISGGGGGGTPAGVSTDVQINNGGAFGSDSGGFFQYATSTHRLSLSQVTSSLFIGSDQDFATSTAGTISSSTTYVYSGATSTFTVPAGVTSITIDVKGAKGGTGSASGGSGGEASGTLAVSPAQVYYVLVGGSGTNGGQAGGFGGGGNSGASGGTCGGGGGMSWFSGTSKFVSSSVIIVAGGAGGGGCAGGVTGTGGNGGGTSGATGGAGGGGANGGGGGTQTAGGAAGTGDGGGATAGTEGQGGNGGAGSSGRGGGGAGGGFFGGGGGAGSGALDGGGGGGGSSFTTSTLTSTSTSSGTNNATGSIVISYQIPAGVIAVSTSSAALYVGGHIYTGNQNSATSSISSCGTSPFVNGDDTAATVNVGGGVVTSCTVNFGTRFVNPPVCTLGVFSTTITGGITSETTSSLIVGFSATLGGGQFNYICLDY